MDQMWSHTDMDGVIRNLDANILYHYYFDINTKGKDYDNGK